MRLQQYILMLMLVAFTPCTFASFTYSFDDDSLLHYFDMNPSSEYLANSTLTTGNKGSLSGIWNWTSVVMNPYNLNLASALYVNNSFSAMHLDTTSKYQSLNSHGLEVTESLNPSGYFLNDSMTYSVWFAKTNSSRAKIEDVFRFQSDNEQQTLRFNTNNTLGMKIRDAGGSEYDLLNIDSTGHHLDYGWHHLCLIFRDRGTSVGYDFIYDNTSVSSGILSDIDDITIKTCTPNDANACDIGHTDHPNLDTFNGSISEFRMYNIGLSTEECGALHDVRLRSGNTYQYPFFTRKPMTVTSNTIQLNYTSTDAISFSYNASQYITVTNPSTGILQVNLTNASLSVVYAIINITNSNGSDTVLLRMNATNATIPSVPESNSLVFYTDFQDNASLFNDVGVLNLGDGSWNYNAYNFDAVDIVQSFNVNGTYQGLNISEAKSQYLQVNTTFNPSTVFTTNEISVSMWLNASSIASGDFEIPFHINNNLPAVVLQKEANDTWRLQTRTTTGTEVFHTYAGVNYITGDWQHLGFTIKNNSANSYTITLYHNGTAVSNQTGTYTGSFFGDDCDFGVGGCGVGKYLASGTFEYKGMMDELRVYSHAITGAEMRQLANLTYLANEPPPATPPTFDQHLQNISLLNGTYTFTLNWSATNDALVTSNDTRWDVVTQNGTQTAVLTWNNPTALGAVYTTFTLTNGDGSDVMYHMHLYFSTNVSPFFVFAPYNDSFQVGVRAYNFTWDATNDAFVTSNDSAINVYTYNSTRTFNATVNYTTAGLYHVRYNISNIDGSQIVDVLYNITEIPSSPTSNTTAGNITLSIDLSGIQARMTTAISLLTITLCHLTGIPAAQMLGGLFLAVASLDAYSDTHERVDMLLALFGVLYLFFAGANFLSRGG